jgi:CMP-N-acetylneuraminic acid synthetase
VIGFVPLKLNSERLPGKNIKPFDNGEPLLTYILKTACDVGRFDALYVYCSSETVCQYLPPKVKYLHRDKWLDLSTTSITDVIVSFTRDILADVYVLLHVTAPFIKKASIERAIEAVVNEGYDSALSVERHNDFLWKRGKPENYDICNIPRTQDLEPFYTETTGMYVFTKALADDHRRIGNRPFLVEVSKLEAVDINEPIDFAIANAIYTTILRPAQGG